MQLTPRSPEAAPQRLRDRVRAAACLLLAAGASSREAHAQEPRWRIEGSGLLYAERQRTTIAEPIARVTRLFKDGASLGAQFALDVMTGASPTGANPSGVAQTTTSASGQSVTTPASQIPTAEFKDTRGALDLSYERPMGLFTGEVATHVSREKDYRSLGVSGKLSVDVDHRLTTITLGGGTNRDRVVPLGGVHAGLTSGGDAIANDARKRVTTRLAGVTRVLTRRWLAGVTVTRSSEDGDLTEPYKVVSLIDPSTGHTSGELHEKRPDSRERLSVLVNSVYHLTQDIVHVSYRYYSDDWNIRSHTIDLKYRIEKPEAPWLEPHVRLYSQSAAEFFHPGLRDDRPLPEFASADQRLGKLRSVTLGATYGFHLPGQPGEWTVRAEYLGQFGESHPPGMLGVQRTYNLAPALHVGSVVVGWTLER